MAVLRWMRASSSTASALATVLGALAWLTPAVAQDEPIDLDYRAYEGCPTAAEFIGQVSGRAAQTLLASERARRRRFIVTVVARRSGALGRLAIEAEGERAAREVTGATCKEVVAALALFTALAIDPDARSEPSAPAPPEADPGAAAGASAARAASSAAAAPLSVPGASLDPPPPEKPGTSTVLPWRAIAGLAALDVSPLAPPGTPLRSALGGALFLEIAMRSDRALTSAARVSVLWAEARPKSATFRLVAGRLDLCPAVYALSRALSTDLCAAVELGAVSAVASSAGGVEPARATRFWAAGDVLGRLRWGPGAAIFVELEAGATFPLTRYDFALGTSDEFQREIHAIPSAGWVLGFGLGGRIL
jgi:hypothetical protein